MQEIGITVSRAISAEHLSRRAPDLVVIGNAVSRDNPEAEAVLSQGIPYISFPQALGQFLISRELRWWSPAPTAKRRRQLWLLGCLTRAGLDPGFFIGGVPLNFGSGWNPGSGDHVVFEGMNMTLRFSTRDPSFSTTGRTTLFLPVWSLITPIFIAILTI